MLAEPFDQIARINSVSEVSTDEETGVRSVEVKLHADAPVHIEYSPADGTPRFAQVIAMSGGTPASDVIFGKVQKVSGDAATGYTLTVALGQAADEPGTGQVRLATADRIGAFKLAPELVAEAEQHYTARVNLAELEWEVDRITQTLQLGSSHGLSLGDTLTANGVIGVVTGVSGADVTVELRRTANVLEGVEALKIGRADDFVGQNDWDVIDNSLVQIYEPVANADGWPSDNRQTDDWSVEVGSNLTRDVYALELRYTPHSPLVGTTVAGQSVTGITFDYATTPAQPTAILTLAAAPTGLANGDTVSIGGRMVAVTAVDGAKITVSANDLDPSEASVLAKLAANPLAELSPMETLINEGIVMPLRPIVNDRLEFNGGTIADRVVMPDQATVLDIQDLSTAKDGYRFRVFVEVTWQDLQDPAFLTGQSVTTGASTALQIVTARETEVEDTLKAQTLTVAASETIEVGDEIVLAGNLRAVVAAVTPEAGQKKVKVVLPTAGEFAAGTVTRESRDGTVTHDIAVSPVTSPAAIGALPYDVFVALRSYGLQGASPKQFFADQGFTLEMNGSTVAEGRVTDWNADLQQITLAGLTSGGKGVTALDGSLRDLVTNGATLISEIDATGGVIVGERVLVELDGDGSDTVKIGSALRFCDRRCRNRARACQGRQPLRGADKRRKR